MSQHNEGVLCVAFIILRGSGMGSSSLLTMVMASERVFAAYRPFRYKETVSISLMTKIGYGCVVVSLMDSAITTNFLGNDSGECLSVKEGVNYVLMMAHFIKTSIAFVLVPTTSTVILNIVLMIKIRNRAKK